MDNCEPTGAVYGVRGVDALCQADVLPFTGTDLLFYVITGLLLLALGLVLRLKRG